MRKTTCVRTCVRTCVEVTEAAIVLLAAITAMAIVTDIKPDGRTKRMMTTKECAAPVTAVDATAD